MRHLLFVALMLLNACQVVPQKSDKVKALDVSSVKITEDGSLSLLAVDMESGDVLASHLANQRMTPASLTKILTTGAALQLLGADYTYQTQFYLKEAGQAKQLIVVGGGDPTLGSDRFSESKPELVFNELLKALQQQQISSLEKLIVDNSCFKGISHPSKRLWEDMGNYYGAVPNGLSYRENTFYLTLKSPNKVGRKVAIVKTEPALEVTIQSHVRSAANTKDSAYIYGHPLMDEWYVSGTIPQGREAFVIKGALPHPELSFARELKAFLKANGILVKSIEKVSMDKWSEGKLLYCHHSPSLSQIVEVINKQSHNLFADHLLFSIAQQNGEASWDSGIGALSNFWKANVPDFSATLFDGSGLSPFNAFSATDMVSVLRWMSVHEQKEVFEQSLSVAGVDGTLKSIFKEPDFQGRMIGKSGSMNGVLGYCGYLTTNKERRVAFCVMANRFTEPFSQVRSNMETLLKEIAEQN